MLVKASTYACFNSLYHHAGLETQIVEDELNKLGLVLHKNRGNVNDNVEATHISHIPSGVLLFNSLLACHDPQIKVKCNLEIGNISQHRDFAIRDVTDGWMDVRTQN